MIFEIVLIVVFFGLLAYWHQLQMAKKRELYEKIKNFPGTNVSYPLIGDLHLAFHKWSIHDKIKYFIKLNSQYPSTFRIWLGTKLLIMVNNPEDVKTVLTSPYCTDKSTVYHAAIGGSGIFVANGWKWKNQRRHLNTTFNAKVLISYSNEFNQFGRNVVEALRGQATSGSQKINITPILGTHITDLITRTVYGSVDHTLELSKYCYNIVERLMLLWGERTFKIYGYLLLRLMQKFFRIVSDEKQMNKQLRSTLQPIFDKKRDEYYEKAESVPEEGSIDTKEENFLEKITRLQCEGTIGSPEYRHTIITMFTAGTETSARSVSNILLMLAMHEEYQEKVYEEICNFIDLYGDGDIDISKLSELSLLDRVIKESLRMFPVTPFIGRKPSRDIPIKDGIIPAGTDIGISLMNIHQDPLIWGVDAHKFNPDNFLPENVAKRERCSFIPFSYGPRNCIGYKFAQISSYIGIIYLIRNYKFKSPLKIDDLKIGYGLTTFLMNDTMMSVHPREK